MKALLACAVCLAGFPLAVVAQDDLPIDQSKLYVSDPAACEALEKKGVDAFMDADFLVLSFKDGIQSMEFTCDLYDIKALPNNNMLFVDAVCQAPGEVYPDTFSISPYDAKTIQLVSTYDAMMAMSRPVDGAELTGNPGVTLYTRCDNLSEIRVD